MSGEPVLDIALLEQRRRLAFRFALGALLVAIAGLLIGRRIGGSDRADTIGGAFLFSAIVGIIAAPWIVRAWQNFMGRRMIAAAVAGRSDIRHIDGERAPRDSQQALASAAFSLGAFRDSGLIEAFESAAVTHILTGEARGVPYAIAEIALLDAKGYRMFGGVLASFRLAQPRPGLTIVARDRGILGNLVASAGSGLERLPLEDPTFEGVFEVYGTDQVGGRVILTTTMLERLHALDQLAHAHGFACAFLEEHLLIALRGMTWRCAPWRILQPVTGWLRIYTAWLAGLVDLPVEIVQTLNLTMPAVTARPFVPTVRADVPLDTGSGGQVFSSGLFRLIGEGGMALITLASGSLFGGLALVGANYGFTSGFSRQLFWYFWGMIAAGIVYGAYAISISVRDLLRLAWRWNSGLRTLKRP